MSSLLRVWSSLLRQYWPRSCNPHVYEQLYMRHRSQRYPQNWSQRALCCEKWWQPLLLSLLPLQRTCCYQWATAGYGRTLVPLVLSSSHLHPPGDVKPGSPGLFPVLFCTPGSLKKALESILGAEMYLQALRAFYIWTSAAGTLGYLTENPDWVSWVNPFTRLDITWQTQHVPVPPCLSQENIAGLFPLKWLFLWFRMSVYSLLALFTNIFLTPPSFPLPS